EAYDGIALGKSVRLGGATWTVVGVFDMGGTAFDSELWCDANVLKQVFQRPPNLFQSATVRLTSPEALTAFKDALTADPRLTVQVDREVDYYAKQSRQLTTLITVLGTIVALVMGIGAVFGALNTMYSAVTERAREIATMRAKRTKPYFDAGSRSTAKAGPQSGAGRNQLGAAWKVGKEFSQPVRKETVDHGVRIFASAKHRGSPAPVRR